MNSDFFDALESEVQSAENHFRRGEFNVALDIYTYLLNQRLSSIRKGMTTWCAPDLVIIERLVDLSVLFSNFQAADDMLEGMVELNEQAGNRYGADYTSLKRIHLTLGRGLLRDAYELLMAMSPSIGDIHSIDFTPSGLLRWERERDWPNIDSNGRAVLFSRLYLVMGWLLAALGQYSNALVALERGLHHTGEGMPDIARQATVPLKLLIAGALLEKGNLMESGVRLAKLESDLDELRQPGFFVRWLELSGKLYLLQGEFGSALKQFNQVLEICHKRGFSQAVLSAALNLAHILILLNQTSVARELLVGVKAKSSELNDTTSVVRATFLLNVANARGHSLADGVSIAPSVSEMWGRVADTPPANDDGDQESPLDLPQSANYLAFFEDRALGFHWYLGRWGLDTAADILSKMKRVFESTDSALIHLRLRIMTGILAYYQNELRSAESALNEVRPSLRDLGLKPELWQVQRILGWCWARLNHSVVERRALTEDIDALLAEMTGSLSGANQAIFQLNKWTVDEEYLADQLDQLVDMKKRLAESPWFRRPFRRWSLMKRLHELMERINRYKGVVSERTIKGSEVSIEVDTSPSSLWRRLLSLPRRHATISFLVLPDRVLVICARRLFLDFSVSSITRIQVRDLVRRWHELVSGVDSSRDLLPFIRDLFPLGPIEDPDNERREIAERLAESLQITDLFKSLPRRVRALTIVPDDSLHGFPFAAIVHEGRYLAERYAISIAFEFNDRGVTITRSDRRDALTVGVSRGTSRISPLPGVPRELVQVERWLTRRALNICRLMNDSAKKAAVRDHLSRSALLHIACHGQFERNQPDKSGMILIPAPEQVDILNLRELSQMNLAGLQHATLSSCWLADNFILPGRWIISLPETLWRAGAQSILACMWPVDDRLAVAFMTCFYDYLDKLPRDEALQRTQLDCLHGKLSDCENIDTANPVYWAGFNLYGDPGPLKL